MKLSKNSKSVGKGSKKTQTPPSKNEPLSPYRKNALELKAMLVKALIVERREQEAEKAKTRGAKAKTAEKLAEVQNEKDQVVSDLNIERDGDDEYIVIE